MDASVRRCPKPGYPLMIGVSVSQLTSLKPAMRMPTRKLSVADLDYLLDGHANSIGALMLHTVAAEVYYQRNTLHNEPWGKFLADITARWGSVMELGDKGRTSPIRPQLPHFAAYSARPTMRAGRGSIAPRSSERSGWQANALRLTHKDQEQSKQRSSGLPLLTVISFEVYVCR